MENGKLYKEIHDKSDELTMLARQIDDEHLVEIFENTKKLCVLKQLLLDTTILESNEGE